MSCGVIYAGDIVCGSCLYAYPIEFDPPMKFEDQTAYEEETECPCCNKFECILTDLFTGTEDDTKI